MPLERSTHSRPFRSLGWEGDGQSPWLKKKQPHYVLMKICCILYVIRDFLQYWTYRNDIIVPDIGRSICTPCCWYKCQSHYWGFCFNTISSLNSDSSFLWWKRCMPFFLCLFALKINDAQSFQLAFQFHNCRPRCILHLYFPIRPHLCRPSGCRGIWIHWHVSVSPLFCFTCL